MHKLLRNSFLIVFLLVFFMNLSALGEEKSSDKEVYELDEIVVSAPVIEGNEINRLGSQITLVSEEQISDLNAVDLTSALRRVPGVVISRHNPVGSFGGGEGGALFIRGHGSSRPGAEIQTLIDGIPKFVSVWTHPVMDVLNVDIVDNIKVYKGAQPVLFGNMAFGAVDIQTKRVANEGFRTVLHGSYGSNNTITGSLEHGGKLDRFDYYLLGGYRSSDGHRENADGELTDVFLHLGYELAESWNANLTFIHTNNWADDPGPADGSMPSDGRFNIEDYFAVFTIANSHEWGNGYIKFYRDRGDIDWVDQAGIPGTDTLTDYQNYGIRAREIFNPWQNGELIVGFDLDYINGEAQFLDPVAGDSSFPEETFRLTSPYAALSQMFGEKEGFHVIPSIGVRYVDHNRFKSETAPQAGLILGYPDTSLHFSYARGINYPGVYTKVQETLWLPGDNRWLELRAEKLDHFEAGVVHSFNKLWTVDLTWFYDKGKDRIVVSPPPPFPPVLTNIDEYRHKGIESTLTVVPSPGLSLFGGFTWLDSEPADFPYSPEWTFSAGLNWVFLDNFQLSLDSLYVDSQYVTSRGRQKGTVNVDQVGSYLLFNGKISYNFIMPDTNKKVQIYLAGENLTDTDYEQKKGYPMQGISCMLGLEVNFR